MTILNLTSAPIDALQDEAISLQKSIERKVREIASLTDEVDQLRQERGAVLAEVERRKVVPPPPIEPKVSDHALVRYIERVHGIDLSTIRDSILTPTIVDAIRMGAERVTINDVRFVVKNGVLVTIIADPPPPPKRKPRRVAGNYDGVDPIFPDVGGDD